MNPRWFRDQCASYAADSARIARMCATELAAGLWLHTESLPLCDAYLVYAVVAPTAAATQAETAAAFALKARS